MRHECYTKGTSVTRVENFDNDSSKNIFSHPYIYYMASERLQGGQQFHSRNGLLEMPRFYAKMRLKRHHKSETFKWQKLYQNVAH